MIALVDGEHHPTAVRDSLDSLERERGIAGVVFCGGEEKLPDRPLGELYGRAVEGDVDAGLRALAADADVVIDLADEPVLPAGAKLRAAALALHLGLAYEMPGARLDPPRYEPVAFDGPKLAVIATGKRTGKTAVAAHWATLLRERGLDPVIVCMGRGGPAEPRVAAADTGLDDLIEIVDEGGHGASDYLEDAVLARVRTIGCRRVGGGLAGEPHDSNVMAGAELAVSLDPAAIVFEGSGACIPPVEVDATVCIVGRGKEEPFAEYRTLRADLVLEHLELRPEPAEELPDDARVAVFTTGAKEVEGVDAELFSTNLSRRRALADDLERARGCDVYLTEIKAAAIDTVAARASETGARVVFLRNRPVGIDEALMGLVPGA